MKYAFSMAWRDMRRRLFASAIMMAQLFVIGLLLIWLAASVSSVWRSLISFYREEIGRKEIVFVDASINQNTAVFNDGLKRIEELCDRLQSSCSVFDIDNDWTLIIGKPELAGQIHLEKLFEADQNKPFILIGSDMTLPTKNSMPWPNSAIRASSVGLSSPSSEMDITVAGRIEHGSYYMNKSGNHSLDRRKILCISFRQYCDLGGNLDLFMNSLQIHALSASQIADLTNLMLKEQNIKWFRPLSINEFRKKELSSVWGSMYFILFVVIFYILMVSGMTFYFLQLIQTNHREYAIHRICGASLGDIKRRMLFFIMYIVLPPSFFLTLSVSLMISSGVPDAPSPLYILTLATLTVASVYYLPALQMERQDIAGFARPD